MSLVEQDDFVGFIERETEACVETNQSKGAIA